MIVALSAALSASAGEYGEACSIFAPIAGTAGFENGLSAVRIQAQTYGAGEFARRRLRKLTWLAWDMHAVAGAAMVPSYCTDTEGKHAGEVYSQPLDLGATNFGLNIPLISRGPLNSRAHVFYASSVTQSVMGARALSWSAPMLNVYPAVAAPLIGRTSASRGLAVYTLDWIGGAYLKSDVISIQAGYTGTRGLYLDLTQEKVALFVNTVLADGVSLTDAAYLMGGLQSFDPRALGVDDEKIGMSSLFYRNLDQSDEPPGRAQPDERVPRSRLKTTHLRQEDILRRFDVRAAWQFGEQSKIREIAAAVHSESWYTREDMDRSEEKTWYVRLGLVNLPDQPTLGVDGGIRPTVRADYEYQIGSQDVYGLRFSLRMNDPDLLDLYPFAYNALGVNFELTYTGSE